MNIEKIDIFSDKGRFLIAGPCSAENEEQIMETASSLASKGISLFRAGIWKPRTRPGCFEGVGSIGLKWLSRVKNELLLPVATEVATAAHVEMALNAGIDVLWIGARTTTNPFAVQEIADALRGVDIPVLVKNPVNPDLELWIGALERLNNNGVSRLGAIHRGFSLYGEKIFRNSPQWQIPLELKNRCPNLPLICDPSHIAGKKELLMLLSQQAMDLNFNGLMLEVHNNPEVALSDAAQQVTPDGFVAILEKLVHRSSDKQTTDFANYRDKLDAIDKDIIALLARRMDIVREIGEVKKEKGLTVFQPFRYKETMERSATICADYNLDAEVVKGVFEVIHSESIRMQLGIMNEGSR